MISRSAGVLMDIMDSSDDDTLEYDIEVVTSSSSCDSLVSPPAQSHNFDPPANPPPPPPTRPAVVSEEAAQCSNLKPAGGTDQPSTGGQSLTAERQDKSLAIGTDSMADDGRPVEAVGENVEKIVLEASDLPVHHGQIECSRQPADDEQEQRDGGGTGRGEISTIEVPENREPGGSKENANSEDISREDLKDAASVELVQPITTLYEDISNISSDLVEYDNSQALNSEPVEKSEPEIYEQIPVAENKETASFAAHVEIEVGGSELDIDLTSESFDATNEAPISPVADHISTHQSSEDEPPKEVIQGQQQIAQEPVDAVLLTEPSTIILVTLDEPIRQLEPAPIYRACAASRIEQTQLQLDPQELGGGEILLEIADDQLEIVLTEAPEPEPLQQQQQQFFLIPSGEDLEREFDEEPPFEQRQVSVKRNRNPREEYTLEDEIGRGKFGTVYKCQEITSGRPLAAKFIHMRRKEDREDVEREVAIMSKLQHRRLLQLYDAFDDGLNEMCLITELVEGGELFERIVDDDFELTEKKAAIFMRQICEGVQYMHSQQIVHLDMKPENILCISKTGNRIKLIDFGLARELDPNNPSRVMFGTPDFAAPEVLSYDTVSLATDMWSVGVICYVLLSGLSPFMGDNDMETMANVTRATYDFDHVAFEPISDLAKDFISKLLVREQTKRMKPDECIEHPWLQRGGAKLEASVIERRQSLRGDALEGIQGLWLLDSSGSPQILSATNTPPLDLSLDKRNLKKYVVRRKWHKTVHAIMALGRMGANLRLKIQSG